MGEPPVEARTDGDGGFAPGTSPGPHWLSPLVHVIYAILRDHVFHASPILG